MTEIKLCWGNIKKQKKLKTKKNKKNISIRNKSVHSQQICPLAYILQKISKLYKRCEYIWKQIYTKLEHFISNHTYQLYHTNYTIPIIPYQLYHTNHMNSFYQQKKKQKRFEKHYSKTKKWRVHSRALHSKKTIKRNSVLCIYFSFFRLS